MKRSSTSVGGRVMADVTQDDRIVDPQVPEEEREFDAALRPRRIDEFVGQDRVRSSSRC